MLLSHGKYNKKDENVIERVLTSHSKSRLWNSMSSTIFWHGVSGKIIKPSTANQRKLAASIIYKWYGLAVGPKLVQV
jgi:phosphate starvation-inducible PhoH-like protein